jgi:hypothetical protein
LIPDLVVGGQAGKRLDLLAVLGVPAVLGALQLRWNLVTLQSWWTGYGESIWSIFNRGGRASTSLTPATDPPFLSS